MNDSLVLSWSNQWIWSQRVLHRITWVQPIQVCHYRTSLSPTTPFSYLLGIFIQRFHPLIQQVKYSASSLESPNAIVVEVILLMILPSMQEKLPRKWWLKIDNSYIIIFPIWSGRWMWIRNGLQRRRRIHEFLSSSSTVHSQSSYIEWWRTVVWMMIAFRMSCWSPFP